MATITTDPVAILKAIKALGTATAAQAKTTRAVLNGYWEDGLVVLAGHTKTGKRGRPAQLFKLTKRGADRVRRSK